MRQTERIERSSARQPIGDDASQPTALAMSVRHADPHAGFDMEVLVGYILLIGVLTSMVFIVAGLVWHWARTGQLGIGYDISGMNFFEFVWRDVQLVAAVQFRPRLLVSLGIVALLLTPFVRVLASMIYFACVARNWKYTVFTAFVLSVLTYSLFLR
jgi:uncharacterized membrane protein